MGVLIDMVCRTSMKSGPPIITIMLSFLSGIGDFGLLLGLPPNLNLGAVIDGGVEGFYFPYLLSSYPMKLFLVISYFLSNVFFLRYGSNSIISIKLGLFVGSL